MKWLNDIVYLVMTSSSYEETDIIVFKDLETAEKFFYDKVEALKKDYFDDEPYPEDFAIDESYDKENKFCTIYRIGWFNQNHTTIALEPCHVQ